LIRQIISIFIPLCHFNQKKKTILIRTPVLWYTSILISVVFCTDDFSSDEDDDAAADQDSGPRCRALYHYSAKLNDELNLEPGEWNRIIFSIDCVKFCVLCTYFRGFFRSNVPITRLESEKFRYFYTDLKPPVVYNEYADRVYRETYKEYIRVENRGRLRGCLFFILKIQGLGNRDKKNR